MSELHKLSSNKYAYLRRLSIEELLELLTIAPIPAASPEKEAYVGALKEAIIEKENENPTGFFPDVDQQWEQFVTHYLPDVDEAALEPERVEYAVSARTNQQSLEVPQKRVVRLSRAWRTALAAAAAIACMFGITLTVQASGIDVFGAMARWTGDVFSFGRIPSGSVVSEELGGETGEYGTETLEPEREFSSLQEALNAYGITEVSEPSWLPDGYALDEIEKTYLADPFFITLNVSYINGSNCIGIDIMSYENEPIMQVQKADVYVKTVEKDGITFYLIENTTNNAIAWYTGQYEYYISGKLDMDILWEMAMSMLE